MLRQAEEEDLQADRTLLENQGYIPKEDQTPQELILHISEFFSLTEKNCRPKSPLNFTSGCFAG